MDVVTKASPHHAQLVYLGLPHPSERVHSHLMRPRPDSGLIHFARVDREDVTGGKIADENIGELLFPSTGKMQEQQDPLPRRDARLARRLQVRAMNEPRRTSDRLVALAKQPRFVPRSPHRAAANRHRVRRTGRRSAFEPLAAQVEASAFRSFGLEAPTSIPAQIVAGLKGTSIKNRWFPTFPRRRQSASAQRRMPVRWTCEYGSQVARDFGPLFGPLRAFAGDGRFRAPLLTAASSAAFAQAASSSGSS